MNQKLIERTNEWKQLGRMTDEQRRIAEAYYDENLMDLIVEDYLERNSKLIREEVKYLLVSVGTSYEPIVLSIKLFRPERILFLYTEKSEIILEKIVSYCGLKAYEYEKSLVNETDPLDVYAEIKRVYLKWNKPEKMYIDFTGGTKAMSTACAMAGAMIDVQLVYVGTDDYLIDFRKPNPGSEMLHYIDNPIVSFGDLEIEKALALFGGYNFSGVKDKMEFLKESIPDPRIRQELNFVYLLAKSYEAWDSLDFENAYIHIRNLNRQLYRDRMHKDYLLMDCIHHLEGQEDLLSYAKDIPKLIKQKKSNKIVTDRKIMYSLMFTMFQNSMTREAQGKFDTATLLLYRLLEMIEQRRLAQYNLYTSFMDYSKMKYYEKQQSEHVGKSAEERIEILKHAISEIKKQLFGKAGSNYLAEQVSLLEGYIILYAFHDPIVYQGEDDKIVQLKKIRAMVYLRNNSIFAHGLGPVSERDYCKFRDYVHELFHHFCHIESIPYDEYMEKITWVNPMESGNYSAVE